MSGEWFLDSDQRKGFKDSLFVGEKEADAPLKENELLKQLTSPKGAKYENKGCSPLKKEVLKIISPERVQ